MRSESACLAAAAFCLYWTLAFGVAEKAGSSSIDIPKLESSVDIDGQLWEDAWSRAAAFTVNEEVATRKATGAMLPPGHETALKIWRSADALYLGFRCENPDMPMFMNAQPRGRDGAPFSDECIEIFITTPAGGSRSSRQFVFNALGSMYDGTWCSGAPDKEWNGEWQVAAAIVRGAWYAEVRIPLSDLGRPGYILINCTRVSYGQGRKSRLSAWQAPGWFDPVFRIDLDK